MLNDSAQILGNLYIIAAPSGAGKTSLVNALVASLDNIQISISYTTRPKRPGEQADHAYHFVDQSTFQQMIEQKAFLEHAQVFGHYYGTSQEWVVKKLQQGIDVILEIDWQGAQQVRHLLPESIGIFILPPSIEQLRERLAKRGQDAPDVIVHRMQACINEMSHYYEFDYLIINDDFQKALEDLKTIILSQRLRCGRQQARYHSLLKLLLNS